MPPRFCGSAKLVHFLSHRRLLVRCVVLVNQTLAGRAVNSLDSNFIGTDGCVTVAFGNSRIKLLQVGLQGGFLSLVLNSYSIFSFLYLSP